MIQEVLQKTAFVNLPKDLQADILNYLGSLEKVGEKAIHRAVNLQKILKEDSELLKKLAQ